MKSRLARDAAAVIGGGFVVAVAVLFLAMAPEKRESLEKVMEAEAAGVAKLFASLTPPTPGFQDMAAALIEPFLETTSIKGVATGDGKGQGWLALGPEPPAANWRFEDVPAVGALRIRHADAKRIDFAWVMRFNNDPDRPYVLAARMDAAYIDHEMAEFMATALAVEVFAATLLTIGMLGFLHLRIIRPVLRLRQRMHDAAADPLRPELYRDAAVEPGEVGDMARSFNVMVERIGETLAARRRAEEAAQAARQRAENALDELRAAQTGLIHAEKMAALGGLVAGVAHEINTPVGNALGAVSHLARKTKTAAELFETGKLRKQDADDFIKSAQEAGDIALANIQRAASLVRSFKQVAADQSADQRRRFRLDLYVDEVLTSLTPQIKRCRLEVAMDIPGDIELDSFPGALAQVLTNLAGNAGLHAYGDDWDGPRPLRIAAARDGDDAVSLTVTDHGRGMTEEVRQKVFEPFFTTKRGAGGTGLGMHIVYNLATQRLGGRITVASDADPQSPERGTTFTLILPLTAP